MKEGAVVVNHTPVENHQIELIRESIWQTKKSKIVHMPLEDPSGKMELVHLTSDNGYSPDLQELLMPLLSTYAEVHPSDLHIDHSFLDKDYDILKDKEKYRTIMIMLDSPIDNPELFEKLLSVSDMVMCPSEGDAEHMLRTHCHSYSHDVANINMQHLDKHGDLFASLKAASQLHDDEGIEEGQEGNKDDDAPNTSPKKILRVLVHGAFGEQIDQNLQSIQTLHKYYLEKQSEKNGLVVDDEIILFNRCSKLIYLQSLNRDSMAVNHRIRLSQDVDSSAGVGLVPIPFGNAAIRNQIETEGLKWNIGKDHEHQTLTWDTVISTNNEIIGLDQKELSHTINVKSFGQPLVLSTTLKQSNVVE